eukprot:IDg3079t1
MAHEAAPIAKVRAYNHALDYERVCDICKNVFGGKDRIPSVLPTLQGKQDHYPIVLTRADGTVVAFCIVVKLPADVPTFLFEGLRVAGDMAGRGYGKQAVRARIAVARTLANNTHPIRILSTTIPSSAPMLRILNVTKFAVRGTAHLWPAKGSLDDVSRRLRNMSAPPPSPSWKRLRVVSAVVAALCDVGAHATCDGVVATYASVDSFQGIAGAHLRDHDVRSVWALPRDGRTVAVVFVTHAGGDIPMSAVVADVQAADAVIWFLVQYPGLNSFRLVFDVGLTAEGMAASAVIKTEECVPFLILGLDE